jgi:hypothetical protein
MAFGATGHCLSALRHRRGAGFDRRWRFGWGNVASITLAVVLMGSSGFRFRKEVPPLGRFRASARPLRPGPARSSYTRGQQPQARRV